MRGKYILFMFSSWCRTVGFFSVVCLFSASCGSAKGNEIFRGEMIQLCGC